VHPSSCEQSQIENNYLLLCMLHQKAVHNQANGNIFWFGVILCVFLNVYTPTALNPISRAFFPNGLYPIERKSRQLGAVLVSHSIINYNVNVGDPSFLDSLLHTIPDWIKIKAVL